ncbi:MAG: Mur ligase domain-containing protein, partial [Planctomycetia bacterium]|nr:Mur ligase domain-containing protein [Planctomycetia bacterium]
MDRSGRGRWVAGIESPHAHVLGIDARGMSGLAQNLVQKGMVVTGSGGVPGGAVAGLQGSGVWVGTGPTRELAITPRTRLLVHGAEVGREHSTRLRALRRGVTQETPADWLHG